MKQRLSYAHVTAAALVLSLAAMSSAQTPQRGGFAGPRIKNFGHVNDHYYRGAQPQKGDFADLAALGIKTVIDLQRDGEPGEQATVEALGMKFFRLGLTTKSAPSSEQTARFLALVNDPANQPVFVHCAGGRHRTGVMRAVYRLTQDGWTADRAYAEMKRYEFEKGLFGHDALKNHVFAYQDQLSHHSVTDSRHSLKAESRNR